MSDKHDLIIYTAEQFIDNFQFSNSFQCGWLLTSCEQVKDQKMKTALGCRARPRQPEIENVFLFRANI